MSQRAKVEPASWPLVGLVGLRRSSSPPVGSFPDVGLDFMAATAGRHAYSKLSSRARAAYSSAVSGHGCDVGFWPLGGLEQLLADVRLERTSGPRSKADRFPQLGDFIEQHSFPFRRATLTRVSRAGHRESSGLSTGSNIALPIASPAFQQNLPNSDIRPLRVCPRPGLTIPTPLSRLHPLRGRLRSGSTGRTKDAPASSPALRQRLRAAT
jgi:hypothetical protein